MLKRRIQDGKNPDGFFIISSILWGMFVDKKKPDKYEIIGSLVAVVGAGIIFYAPR
jgi:small multidrug resistance family-3 protein